MSVGNRSISEIKVLLEQHRTTLMQCLGLQVLKFTPFNEHMLAAPMTEEMQNQWTQLSQRCQNVTKYHSSRVNTVDVQLRQRRQSIIEAFVLVTHARIGRDSVFGELTDELARMVLDLV